MYSIDWSKVFARKPRGSSAPAEAETTIENKSVKGEKWLPTVSQTVWGLGFTSLLTDISSEMVASILPAYLVLYLGMSPMAFGVLDGIYQGGAALVGVVSGVLADRWRRYKEVALVGYGLSAACRLLILVAGNAWGMITAIITLDRIGKGIRTAPRDALISQRSAAADLATAFGVHRALDAAGAMLGPIIAFALLALMPQRFDMLFIVSFGVAVIGLGTITFFVPRKVPGERQIIRSPGSFRKSLELFGNARYRGLLFAGVILGFVTISESFIFLVLQRRFDFSVSGFPLLYVGTALFTSAFSIPCGRLADRMGRTSVLFGGYGVLAIVYVVLLLPATEGGLLLIAAVVFLLGIFYAATDGVLTAMAAATLPRDQSGSGLAVLATTTNLARLVSSVAFGILWAYSSIGQAVVCYFLAFVVAIVSAYFVLNRSAQHVS